MLPDQILILRKDWREHLHQEWLFIQYYRRIWNRDIGWWHTVTTMSSSGSYLVTPVASQYSRPTPVTHSYSGHGRTDMPPLSMTLCLIPIQSLLHLTVYPVCLWVLRVLDISCALYHFHQTWPSPYSGRSLSAFRLFTCHRIYLSLVCT